MFEKIINYIREYRELNNLGKKYIKRNIFMGNKKYKQLLLLHFHSHNIYKALDTLLNNNGIKFDSIEFKHNKIIINVKDI